MKFLGLFFAIGATLSLGGCITGSSVGGSGSGGASGLLSSLGGGASGTSGGSSGGTMGGLEGLIRNVSGQQNNIENAKIETQSVMSSLNSLEQTLPFIRSYEQGEQIYMNLNSAWSQLTGVSALAHLTTQYPSVNVVHEQIANLREFLKSEENIFSSLNNDKLNAYVQKLQMVNQTITSASIAVNSIAQGSNPIGGGQTNTNRPPPGSTRVTNY